VADRFDELAGGVLVERQQQFFLACEMLVERAQAQVRAVDERLDGEIGATGFLDQFQRRGQEARTTRQRTRTRLAEPPLDGAFLPTARHFGVGLDTDELEIGVRGARSAFLRSHDALRIRVPCTIHVS
jgi:hypothetical protein